MLVFAEITDHQNKFLWYRYLLEKLPLVNYSTLKCIVTHIWKWVSFFHIHLYLIFHLKILGAVIKWENGTHEYYWIKLNIFFLKSASINFHTQVWPDILYQVWPLLHFIWLSEKSEMVDSLLQNVINGGCQQDVCWGAGDLLCSNTHANWTWCGELVLSLMKILLLSKRQNKRVRQLSKLSCDTTSGKRRRGR